MTKKNLIMTAAILGAIALAVGLISLRISITADGVAGYGSVLFLLGIAALEYSISWRRLTRRSSD
jgi:hypothetical protein